MNGTRPHAAPDDLRLFAYGTLKRGFENHDRYCRGARAVVPAWVWGRLHAWTPDIPILSVPPETVLFTGTRDQALDLQQAPHGDVSERAPHSGSGMWRRIRGDLVALPDSAARLRVLDALEGFHPRAPGHYARVLVPVHLGVPGAAPPAEILAAWAYVVPREATAPTDSIDLDAWV